MLFSPSRARLHVVVFPLLSFTFLYFTLLEIVDIFRVFVCNFSIFAYISPVRPFFRDRNQQIFGVFHVKTFTMADYPEKVFLDFFRGQKLGKIYRADVRTLYRQEKRGVFTKKHPSFLGKGRMLLWKR